MMNEHRIVVEVFPDKTRGTINPNIFGLHLEHIWNCVYPCVWVGPDSDVPNTSGIRNDTTRLLAALRPTVCKYPGGYFSDFYDWRDGVGPREKRPVRVCPTQPGCEERNEFGTAEFMAFCRMIGAEPYLAANTTSIEPNVAAHWVEYCNLNGNTEWARKRREHGFPEPFNVRYWAIGNEPYWLHSVEEYAQIWQRWSQWMYNTDPAITLVLGGLEPDWPACEPWNTDGLWMERMLKTTRAGHGMFSHDWNVPPSRRELQLSLHPYFDAKPECAEGEYYAAFAELSRRLPALIGRSIELMDASRGKCPRPGLCFDEYGLLHSGHFSMSGNMTQPALFWSALWLGCFFHICFEHPDDVAMAALPGTVNMEHALLLLDEGRMVTTPSYHLFKLFRDHGGAQALVTEVRGAPTHEGAGLPLVWASASRPAGKGAMTLSIINLDLERRAQVEIVLNGASAASARAQELSAGDIHARNSASAPSQVTPREAPVSVREGRLACTLAPHSITVLAVEVEA